MANRGTFYLALVGLLICESTPASSTNDNEAKSESTLIVKSDALCELVVNGTAKGTLAADTSMRLNVDAGEHSLECTTQDGRTVERSAHVEHGGSAAVRLGFPPAPRFTTIPDGIADQQQRLVWANADNGSDINWGDAQRYCRSKGSGWALPDVKALQSLYEATGYRRDWKMTYEVTTYDVMAKLVTPLIQVSSCCFWSQEANGPAAAWVVFLDDGSRLSGAIGSGYFGRRALCVRPF